MTFEPLVKSRNYPPQRIFVTKWDVEIDRNRIKKLSRSRERDSKYLHNFDDFDNFDYRAPITFAMIQAVDNCNKRVLDEIFEPRKRPRIECQ